MELFLASANEREIRDAYNLPITGVLTNSSILKKEIKPLNEICRIIDTIGNLEFGLQIASTKEKEMLEEVKIFQSLIQNRKLHLKIPYCLDAFKIINKVEQSGMILNITAISTLPQAFIALEANIDYLSIYVGRVTDAGGDGVKLLKEIKDYAMSNSKKTKILAASIRNSEHLVEVAKAGADAVAIPFALLSESIKSEITTKSVEGFKQDWFSINKG